MASYTTVKGQDAIEAIAKTKGFEPLIHDGDLVAIIAGDLRIYADKGTLVITKRDDAP